MVANGWVAGANISCATGHARKDTIKMHPSTWELATASYATLTQLAQIVYSEICLRKHYFPISVVRSTASKWSPDNSACTSVGMPILLVPQIQS